VRRQPTGINGDATHNGDYRGAGGESVISALLVLFERLRQDVDAAFQRYECEMHRFAQKEHGKTASNGCLARSPTSPIMGESARSNWASRTGFHCPSSTAPSSVGVSQATGEGTSSATCVRLAEVNEGSASVSAGQAGEVVLDTEEDIDMGRMLSSALGPPISAGKKHQTHLAASLQKNGCDLKHSSSQLTRSCSNISANRIRRSKKSQRRVPDDICIDSVVLDVASMDKKGDLLGRICGFKFNARPLVSERSRMRKIMASREYTNLRIVVLLTDAIFLILTLHHASMKVTFEHDVNE